MAPEPFSKTVFHKVATEVQCSASSLLCTIHTGKGRGGRGQLSRTPHILFIFASAERLMGSQVHLWNATRTWSVLQSWAGLWLIRKLNHRRALAWVVLGWLNQRHHLLSMWRVKSMWHLRILRIPFFFLNVKSILTTYQHIFFQLPWSLNFGQMWVLENILKRNSWMILWCITLGPGTGTEKPCCKQPVFLHESNDALCFLVFHLSWPFCSWNQNGR